MLMKIGELRRKIEKWEHFQTLKAKNGIFNFLARINLCHIALVEPVQKNG